MHARTLLSEFFSAPNRITLERFAEKRGGWTSGLELGADRTRLSFLPHLSPESRMVWYAIGTPSMPTGELVELCRGFVGVSYAERIDILDPARSDQPHERALLAFTSACSGPVARVDLGVLSTDRSEDADRTAAAFELMERLISSRPSWSGYTTRSLAQVLADLDLAFAEGDVEGAEELLVEVERSHSISEVNLQFLRIRMLQAVGRGAEVLRNPQLGYLVHARRPRKVTRALLEAAHDEHLVGIPLEREALEAAGAMILAALGPAAVELIDPGTAKEALSLLASGLAYGRGPAELSHVARWLERNAGMDSLATRLLPAEPSVDAARSTTTAPGADALEQLSGLVMEGRPVEALELLRQQTASVRTARLAFQIDGLLGNRESAEILLILGLEVLGDLDERGDAKVIQRLDELTGALPEVDAAAEDGPATVVMLPASWQEWLDQIPLMDPRRSMRNLVEIGASSWTADANSAKALAAALETLDEQRIAAVRSVAGIIAEAHSGLADVDALLALRAALLELVALSGLPTTQELRVIVGWAETILGAATEQSTIERALDALEVFIGEHPTPALAEALADLAAIVAYHPAAGARRYGFVLQVLDAIRSAGAGVDIAVRATAARAAADVGTPLHEEDDFWASARNTDDWMPLLDGLRIGIHTLMGSVASRVRAELEPHVGSGSVTTNDDHVATDALRTMASGSDVVVLVTGAAKHSASEEIERHCPEAKLVRIASKGMSGLLRGLEHHLRNLRTAQNAA